MRMPLPYFCARAPPGAAAPHRNRPGALYAPRRSGDKNARAGPLAGQRGRRAGRRLHRPAQRPGCRKGPGPAGPGPQCVQLSAPGRRFGKKRRCHPATNAAVFVVFDGDRLLTRKKMYNVPSGTKKGLILLYGIIPQVWPASTVKRLLKMFCRARKGHTALEKVT